MIELDDIELDEVIVYLHVEDGWDQLMLDSRVSGLYILVYNYIYNYTYMPGLGPAPDISIRRQKLYIRRRWKWLCGRPI